MDDLGGKPPLFLVQHPYTDTGTSDNKYVAARRLSFPGVSPFAPLKPEERETFLKMGLEHVLLLINDTARVLQQKKHLILHYMLRMISKTSHVGFFHPNPARDAFSDIGLRGIQQIYYKNSLKK